MLKQSVPSYFKARRDALMNRVMKKHPNTAFVLPSNEEVLRNPDVHYPFRQESNLYYLTGFDEPESCLVMVPAGSKPGQYRSILFVRRRDPEREMWDGERYGAERAQKLFQVDDAYEIGEFSSRLPGLLGKMDDLFYRMGVSRKNDELMLGILESVRKIQGRSGKALVTIKDPNEVIGELRLFKGPEEIEILRKACAITAEAHKTVMEQLKPGWNEYEVEALLNYVFRKNGCQRNGYGSIVAGGKNAACLHYTANNEELRDGDLLLIDAGGELDYYTSDITRTFPVGKKFSKTQAKAYDLVLQVQKAAIEKAKPGNTMAGLHAFVCEATTEGLLSMGLLKGDKQELIEKAAFRRYFPHGTGHWLGVDVHDVGLYKLDDEPRPLEPGMVFTIEPGFYVQPGDKETPPEYQGIGIRIEDNILVTANGNENFTSGAPKERDEIEALRENALK